MRNQRGKCLRGIERTLCDRERRERRKGCINMKLPRTLDARSSGQGNNKLRISEMSDIASPNPCVHPPPKSSKWSRTAPTEETTSTKAGIGPAFET